MKISFVVAVSDNGVIGSHNSIPWMIPEDLKHFKNITMGHVCLMGKHTYDSIISYLGKPLPGRTNVVVTRQTDFQPPEGVIVYHDLNKALKEISTDELMVIGGGQIYQQLIDMEKVDRIYMTHVHKYIDGDVFFPKIDYSKWKKVSEEQRPDLELTWVTYEK